MVTEEDDGTLDRELEERPRLWTLVGLAIAALAGLGLYGPYAWSYSPEQVCSEQMHVSYEECLSAIALARAGGW